MSTYIHNPHTTNPTPQFTPLHSHRIMSSNPIPQPKPLFKPIIILPNLPYSYSPQHKLPIPSQLKPHTVSLHQKQPSIDNKQINNCQTFQVYMSKLDQRQSRGHNASNQLYNLSQNVNKNQNDNNIVQRHDKNKNKNKSESNQLYEDSKAQLLSQLHERVGKVKKEKVKHNSFARIISQRMPKDTNQDGVIPSMFQYYKCRLDGASVSVVRKRSDFKMSDSRFKINRLFVEENMKSWTRKLETEQSGARRRKNRSGQ